MEQGSSYLPSGVRVSSTGRTVTYDRALAWKVLDDDETTQCIAFLFMNWSFLTWVSVASMEHLDSILVLSVFCDCRAWQHCMELNECWGQAWCGDHTSLWSHESPRRICDWFSLMLKTFLYLWTLKMTTGSWLHAVSTRGPRAPLFNQHLIRNSTVFRMFCMWKPFLYVYS